MGGAIDKEAQKYVAKMLQEILKKALGALKEKISKMSLDEFPYVFKESIMELVGKEEKEKNRVFCGGKFNINLQDNEEYFNLGVDLYFKNTEDKWIKLSSASEWIPLVRLNKSASAELQSKKTVTFDISK
ncbi:MAG: hypothetical protein K6G18_06825 [Treponema sp.]|nr:hypothetical protein [Treponema sp.]